MDNFSAEHRNLFESVGADLYAAIVAEAGFDPGDARLKTGPTAAAFQLLADLHLIHLDTTKNRWLPADPVAAQAQVVSPLSLEGARLLDESAQWSHNFATLSSVWRSYATAEERGPFTYLRGRAISPYLLALVSECGEELLTAQPQAGRDTGTKLTETVADTERDLLARGARMLTLYQHSARRSAATRDYVAAVTELGGEIRTLDEFFNRLIIVDRRVALIPAPNDLSVATVIREPTIVAYLVDMFLRSWERARPFTARDASARRHIAQEQRAMTLRMLAEGYPDPAAAKRLGVSTRTYAGYVADLKEEFDTETRFQLGFAIGSVGLPPDPEIDIEG